MTEWRMYCLDCKLPWLRYGTIPTLCPFRGCIYTVAVRVKR